MGIWTCNNCKERSRYADKVPAQLLKACVFYGDYGRPPFNKTGYNNAPLIAKFLYCEKCVNQFG